MQLYASDDTTVHERAGLVCRQSRLGGLLSTIVVCGLFGGAPVLLRSVGAPWYVWGAGAALAVLIVIPIATADLVDRFRRSNWLMVVRPDGLWINARSYRNHRMEEAATVIHVPYDEIAGAYEDIATYSTPSGHRGQTRRWKQTSLNLKLTHAQTDEVQAALAAERGRRTPERVYFGFVRVSGRTKHNPVTLPSDDVIRIAWRGGPGNSTVPRLKRVLGELSTYVRTTEPTQAERRHWSQLTDREVDEQVLELARSGATIEAVKLLVHRRGYSTTEAREVVEGLSGS